MNSESSEMIELARSSVQTWECDQMGHMNVQFYLERAEEAHTALAAALGLGPRYMRQNNAVLAPIDQHMRFLKELRAGAPFTIHGGVAVIEKRVINSYVEMRHALTGVPCATFFTAHKLAERDTREAKTLPGWAIERAASFRVVAPEHGRPRGLVLGAPRPTPLLRDADTSKLLPTFQGQVLPQHCDRAGFMLSRHYMARVSDAIPNLIGQMHGADRSSDARIGGAALEYRFVYRRAAQDGDVIAIRSGLKAVGAKTCTWCHWVFDLDTGDSVATTEAIAVSMDMASRKAVEIPPEMRAELEARIVPGLSV